MPHAINFPRSTMTPEMKTALKGYIVKQRQKKKEEEEQDEALRNERKRLEEKKLHDQHSLEEVNKQIGQLEKKLTEYKQEKHDLFAQLKKVLHQEDEQRKRMHQLQQRHAKEASEVLAKVGPAVLPPPAPLLGSGSSSDEQSTPTRLAPTTTPVQNLHQLASSTQVSPSLIGPAPVVTLPLLVPAKRQRSPSPSATVKEPAPYPAYFSSPKRLATPYQRSPFQSPGFGQDLHSPPPMVSPRMQHAPGPPTAPMAAAGPVNHYPPYVSPPMATMPAPPQSYNATTPPAGVMNQPRGQFRLHDIRPPQGPPNMGQRPPGPHVSSVGIPVIPPQKRMGSITSGYPVHKPSPGPPPPFQRPAPYYTPRSNIFPHPHRFA